MYSNINKEIEIELMSYRNTRTKLADRIREHDLLELDTRLQLEDLKMSYEEEGYKSTQAKHLAEADKQLKLKELIELEHEINHLKGTRDFIEYKLTHLFQCYLEDDECNE